MLEPDSDATARDATSTHALDTDAFLAAADLFATGVALMRQNLTRRHPRATSDTIDQMLYAWLRERPGAVSGDCAGRSVDLSVRQA